MLDHELLQDLPFRRWLGWWWAGERKERRKTDNPSSFDQNVPQFCLILSTIRTYSSLMFSKRQKLSYVIERLKNIFL